MIRGALFLLAQGASACTVCMGFDKNANTAKALTWGIALLAGTVMTVLAAIVYACWRIEKRKIETEKLEGIA